MTMRLDRLLSELGVAARSELRSIIRSGRVSVDGAAVTAPEKRVDPGTQHICLDGEALLYRQYRYFMMDKPAGVLSVTEDRKQQTVLDLLPPALRRLGLFPVGRLDKDTSGLLLLTNDGEMMNHLLHPSHEVSKVYLVKASNQVSEEEIRRLRRGVMIDEKLTSPAEVRLIRRETVDTGLLISIHEGRNRQVRKMLEAIGHQVVSLKRVEFGPVSLGDLPRGQWRRLTEREVAKLKAL